MEHARYPLLKKVLSASVYEGSGFDAPMSASVTLAQEAPQP